MLVKNTDSSIISCWGGYEGLQTDNNSYYLATKINMSLNNLVITIKIQYQCPYASIGCYKVVTTTNSAWYI